jgi:hypothetical protein
MHNWTSALRGRVNTRFTEAEVAKMAANNKAAGGGGTRKSRKNRKSSRKAKKTRSRR